MKPYLNRDESGLVRSTSTGGQPGKQEGRHQKAAASAVGPLSRGYVFPALLSHGGEDRSRGGRGPWSSSVGWSKMETDLNRRVKKKEKKYCKQKNI